jgi:hypothetical protein
VCVEAVPVTRPGSRGTWTTGNDGGYDLSGLAPGQYRVYAGQQSCSYNAVALVPRWYAGVVQVTAGTTTAGIGLTLAEGGSITGTVRGSTSGHGSRPVAGICVLAMREASGATPVVAVSGADGSYAETSLLPGKYRVEFEPGCGASGYQTRWYKNAPGPRHAAVIMVAAAAATQGIGVTLPRG